MEKNKVVKIVQKRSRAASRICAVIIALVCLFCTILPVSANVVGNADTFTDLDLDGVITYYTKIGQEIIPNTTGDFPLVNYRDEYNNFYDGEFGMNYGNYAVEGNYSRYKLYPRVSNANAILNQYQYAELQIGPNEFFVEHDEELRITTSGGTHITRAYVYFEYDYTDDEYEGWQVYEYEQTGSIGAVNIDFTPNGQPIQAVFIRDLQVEIKFESKTNASAEWQFYVYHTIYGLGANLSPEYSAGYKDGYKEGVEIGKNEGISVGYQNGLIEGREEGYANGYEAGSIDGYEEGYIMGYSDGAESALGDNGEYTGFLFGLFHGVTSFFSAELFPGFSIGGLLSIVLAVPIVLAILKFIAGG